MVVGKLVETACRDLRRHLLDSGYLADEDGDFVDACRAYVRDRGGLRASAQYQPRLGARWDDERYEGDAYGAYAWAAYVAEVTVDMTPTRSASTISLRFRRLDG